MPSRTKKSSSFFIWKDSIQTRDQQKGKPPTYLGGRKKRGGDGLLFRKTDAGCMHRRKKIYSLVVWERENVGLELLARREKRGSTIKIFNVGRKSSVSRPSRRKLGVRGRREEEGSGGGLGRTRPKGHADEKKKEGIYHRCWEKNAPKCPGGSQFAAGGVVLKNYFFRRKQREGIGHTGGNERRVSPFAWKETPTDPVVNAILCQIRRKKQGT